MPNNRNEEVDRVAERVLASLCSCRVVATNIVEVGSFNSTLLNNLVSRAFEIAEIFVAAKRQTLY